jgi:two-component system sensor histidine kinase KdpD
MIPVKSALRNALIGDSVVASSFRTYFLALVACVLTTAIAAPLSEYFDLANIVMLFLLTVLLVAVRLGRGPAVMASFLSVALFDFFFVPPQFSFTVNDPQYLLTFAVMLVVALIIGQLTADLKRQANDARIKERRTHALYEMARELAGALTLTQVTEISRRFLRDAIDAQSAFLLPDATGKLELAENGNEAWSQVIAPLMAKLAYENAACTDLDAPYPVGYFPLKAPTRVRGVMAIASPTRSAFPLHEHHEFLETVASLIAIAVERLHYAEGAQPELAGREIVK